MFTGIVTDLGKFLSLKKSGEPVLKISASFKRIPGIGDSVSINGTCLTLISKMEDEYSFNISGETLSKTTFPDLCPGDIVNLELALSPDGFLGGHIVNGHIDGTVRVRKVENVKGSLRYTFTYLERGWRKLLVNKGSVALNGVSLTLNTVESSWFSVDVIPHTIENTNMKYLKTGERVNIELDLIAKYLYNFKLNLV